MFLKKLAQEKQYFFEVITSKLVLPNIFLFLYYHLIWLNAEIVAANDEQYHQKLKDSCNFVKKQRSKINFLSIKLHIRPYTCKKPLSKLLWKWLLACVSQIYSFIDKKFVFGLCFLSKLQLCLSLRWYCSSLNYTPEIVFWNVASLFKVHYIVLGA